MIGELVEHARETLGELRVHYDDTYWWADRPVARTIVMVVCAGTVGLVFAYLEIKLKARITDGI
jgi:hypothetical protein